MTITVLRTLDGRFAVLPDFDPSSGSAANVINKARLCIAKVDVLQGRRTNYSVPAWRAKLIVTVLVDHSVFASANLGSGP